VNVRPLLAAVLVSMLAACSRETGSIKPKEEPTLPPGAIPVESVGTPKEPEPPSRPAATSERSDCSCAGTPTSFASLAKNANPSVVTILSRIEERSRMGRRRRVNESLGTGFVYDKSGLILTNHHVIAKSIEVSVKFADGRVALASVVGSDSRTDIAVLRVDEHPDFHPLPLGDSDRIEVGDWVVAIGNPFGLSHTVSAGILSAKGRTQDDVGLDPSGYYNFLQTDAAINQGNSGGPLLNVAGEVVGINSAIRANANSIGFAIPINMVKQLLPILVREGKITRSALGVLAEPINEAESVRLGRPDRKGAWIKMVLPGGGADRAGLSVDDVILEFNGNPIADPNELRWLASIAGVGKTVTVRVQRGERVFDLRVTLGALHEPLEDEFGFPRMP